MRNAFFFFSFITITLTLAACTPSTLPITETSVPIETFLPPTSTITPTETIVPTPAIPDYMKPFFEGGYDKVSASDKLYFVYDETSVQYASGNGIIFNERVIKSWVEIGYVENGEFKRGIILNLVIRGGNGLFKDYGKFVWASSISQMGTQPSMTFMENNNRFFSESTPDTSYPIMYAPLIYHPTGDAELYEGIFPMIDGKLQPVNIPGIGIVLPIGNVKPLSLP